MISPGTRRRAEALDAALNARATEAPADVAPLITLALALSRVDLPEATPDPAFQARLRTRVVAMAQVAPSAAEARQAAASARPAAVPRRRLSTALGGVAAASALMATTAVYADGALPGDALYRVDLGVERVADAVIIGDVAGGGFQLRRATERREEVEGLLDRAELAAVARAAEADPSAAGADTVVVDEATTELVAETLRRMDGSTQLGTERLVRAVADSGDAQPGLDVLSFAADQGAALDRLAARIPAELADDLARSASVVQSAAMQAAAAVLAVGGELPADVPLPTGTPTPSPSPTSASPSATPSTGPTPSTPAPSPSSTVTPVPGTPSTSPTTTPSGTPQPTPSPTSTGIPPRPTDRPSVGPSPTIRPPQSPTPSRRPDPTGTPTVEPLP